MEIEERVDAFISLGEYLKNLPQEKFKSLAESIRNENAWFTEANLRMAVSGILLFLDENNLRNWVKDYSVGHHPPRQILLIMAGNIPLAGFHDFLCVLINGDAALIKPSSKDTVLINYLTKHLTDINPNFATRIRIGESFKNFDAVIATGSDNSSRYFDYYFGKYPHIIRRNRTSIGIVDGSETNEQISALGLDVFSYFGMGCRNVSKLFVPQGFDFHQLFSPWESYKDIELHHKYYNNYCYQKSILSVSQIPHLDNGFLLLQESDKLVSPLAVLYYQYYQSMEELSGHLSTIKNKLQCIVGNNAMANVGFGAAQYPSLHDYADGIDTMAFLQRKW
jgi:hypothetical protein